MELLAAPLQGFTDYVWRNAHSTVFAGNVSCYYAPFLRIEKGAFRNKDLRDIAPENNTAGTFVPQVIACPAEQFALLIDKTASMGYRSIDINMGCPFPPLVKRHCGAGILSYPNEVSKLLDIAKKFNGIDFSIKMRLGVACPDEWETLMPIIAGFDPIHVTLHPRTAMQQYSGNIDMEQFSNFYAAASFPVVYNGDITTNADIGNIAAKYPQLRAIMAGRGLLANPALNTDNLQYTDEICLLENLHNLLFEQYRMHLCGDAHLLAKMKSLWEYFLAGRGSRKCRKKIMKSSTIEKYRLAVEEFWQSLADIGSGIIPGQQPLA